MENFKQAIALKQELDKLRPILPAQEARILQKFRLDWNYHSNHLEGNSLTYGETKTLILFGITAQGKPLKDHLEMRGHNDALNWVMDVVKGDFPLTEVFIRELHKLLLGETYEVDAITTEGKPTKRWIGVGSYKTVPNHVKTRTGEIHYFASVEDTPAMMQELLEWCREKLVETDVNPILLAAVFHHRFISIHPFDDGNGRTGRILMNFILMQLGYPPVIIKTDDKLNYYHALQQADGGNVDAFVEYITVNLIRSLEIMIAGARGESIEEPDDLDKELALLEQRMKGVGKELEVEKSPVIVQEVYVCVIQPMFGIMQEEWRKFDHLYAESTIFINLNGKHKQFSNFNIVNGADLVKAITPLEVEFSHQNMPRKGLESLVFNSKIAFQFHRLNYAIISQNKTLELSYSDQPSEEEMRSIIKSESKRHLEFINQKLAELEAGKNPAN